MVATKLSRVEHAGWLLVAMGAGSLLYVLLAFLVTSGTSVDSFSLWPLLPVNAGVLGLNWINLRRWR